ncbi:MAG: NAAT family transporter [Chlamydiae bacterium]|nr:NAAT family transporter [Chlamydiota bacterium]
MLDELLSIRFISVTITFFLLMDGPGNIPIFLSLLRQVPPKRQAYIIARELVIALLIMFFFAFCGNYVLDHLGIENQTIQMAGGIILFMIAIKMVFGTLEEPEIKHHKEPLIVPLAVPLVAGPSILATIMVYSKDIEIQNIVPFSIVAAWILTTLILLLATPIQRILGERGIIALEKLMGLVLTLIAVQLFLDGLYTFLNS